MLFLAAVFLVNKIYTERERERQRERERERERGGREGEEREREREREFLWPCHEAAVSAHGPCDLKDVWAWGNPKSCFCGPATRRHH